jgi:hypothetical protein
MTNATEAGDGLMGNESKLLRYLASQSPNATKSVLYSRVAELIATKGEEAALDYFSAVIAAIMDAGNSRGR